HELTHVAQQSNSSSADASAWQRAERQAAENAQLLPRSGYLPSFEPAPRNTLMRQDKDAGKGGANQTQSAMTRAQFEDVMKHKFRVSTVRTGTFADQQFGDMKESDWEAWPTSSTEAPYSLIMDAINSVVATLGGMPPVQEIIFSKTDWEKDPNSQGSIP